MAVVVVAEDDDINEKQCETNESEHGEVPNLFVSDFQHKPETHQDFGGNEKSWKHCGDAVSEDVKAVDIKLETVDAEQFQHRRHEKNQPDKETDEQFWYS